MPKPRTDFTNISCCRCENNKLDSKNAIRERVGTDMHWTGRWLCMNCYHESRKISSGRHLKKYYNDTNSCEICGIELITGKNPRREIDKKGNFTGRWLCNKCHYKESKQNNIGMYEIKDMTYKSYRIIEGRPSWVIVDINGKIIDIDPSNDKLKNAEMLHEKMMSKPIYTDKELLDDLKRFYKENGRIPRRRDFVNNPEYAGFTTYSIRFGSWSNALRLVEMDTDFLVKQGNLETTQLIGRRFELMVIDIFENRSIDLSGHNCNSYIDGICPNGQTYEVKSSRLYKYITNGGYWRFGTDNKDKDEDKEHIQWYYLGAFDESYKKLLYVWRIPGEMVEKTNFFVGMYGGMYNIENMKEYDISYKFKKFIEDKK